jgi:hypothetical protein
MNEQSEAFFDCSLLNYRDIYPKFCSGLDQGLFRNSID